MLTAMCRAGQILSSSISAALGSKSRWSSAPRRSPPVPSTSLRWTPPCSPEQLATSPSVGRAALEEEKDKDKKK